MSGCSLSKEKPPPSLMDPSLPTELFFFLVLRNVETFPPEGFISLFLNLKTQRKLVPGKAQMISLLPFLNYAVTLGK